MDFDRAIQKYTELRAECAAIEAKAKKEVALKKQLMADIEAWLTAKAQEEGLKTVPTIHGTAYWSVVNSCTVASREDFLNYVKEHGAWDLLETRASSTAVKSFIEANNEAPPGVNFGSIRRMNVRGNSTN